MLRPQSGEGHGFTPRNAGIFRRLVGARRAGTRAGAVRFSGKAGAVHHSVSGRRHQRRAGPGRRGKAAGEVGPGPLAINHSLYKQLSYRPDDFVPITVLGSVPNLITVRADLGVDTVAALIKLAKANPGKLTYGSQGVGSTPNLNANMFMNMTGTQFVHVPYRGETLVVNDMLGGHVDLFFGNISPVLPHYRDGKFKILAVADTARAPAIPDVPTSAEAGLPGFLSTAWFAVMGPPKLPGALAQRIAADFIEAVKMPDVAARYRAVGTEPVGSTPAQTAAFIREETARWREVIVKNNIQVE
jgi:tripartite-type tricarboxylate transporter receptor subunit TctC